MCFWDEIVGNPDKLSGKIYRLLFKLFISGNRDIPWMNGIKPINRFQQYIGWSTIY